MASLPYWRLSSFYLFYFAALGALVPYWGLYLKDLGFDPIAIGELMAILMGTKIVAPFLWGWLGDRLEQRMAIVRSASLVAMLVFVSVYWVDTFWPMALAMVWYSFFWNASLPQFEAVTFGYLGDRARHYARIRVWGSIGFIATVMLLGVLVDREGTRVILHAVLLLYVGIWLSTLWVRDPPGTRPPAGQPSLVSVLQRPSIVAFFVAVLLMQLSHGPYYTFFSIHMEQQGHSKALIGQLWALGVGAEVLLFLVMHHLLHRWGGRRVLVGSLIVAAVRWLMIGWLPESLGWMLLAQCLHAATFGAFHASAIYLVHHYFQGRHQGRGQALYSSVSFGAGGAAGSLLGGYLWLPAGPAVTYSLAAAVAVVGAVVAWRGIDASHDH